MVPGTPLDDRSLRAGLARVRRRWFLNVWARVAARWAAVTLLVGAAAASLIAAVHPAGLALVATVVSVAVLSVVALGAIAWPWRARPTDLQVARYAEEAIPELEERLLTAADVVGRPVASRGPLDALVIAEGARVSSTLDLDRILPARQIAARSAVAGVALLALGGTLYLAAPYVARAWYTARATWFPASLALVVEPGDTAVVEGGRVALRVRIEGVKADAWDAPVTVHSAAGHLRGVPPLARDGDAYATSLPAGQSSFFYRVATGRLVSPEYRVEVRRRPRVERIALSYAYPSFSGLPPRTEDDGGDVFAPKGTRVSVRVRARDAVAGGSLDFASAGPVALVPVDDRTVEARFVVGQDDAYRVTLRDSHGLTGEGETEFFVRPMEDRPPDVRILRPGGDSRVTRLEEVVIEARADDDHGVTRFELVYAPRGGAERVVPLGGGGPSVTGTHTVYIEDLDVRPGDFVTYYARARDVGRGKPSTETRSDIFFLEVRPFNEEFEAAQSQAGQAAGDGAMEELARLQKDIIVATWRLDRRSGAGRSAQDIRAVAKAQSDLRARAQQAAQRSAPRASMPRVQLPPAPLPPAPAPRTPPDPPQESAMQRAVAAMGRAHASLEALKTGEALPHENEALNELLRAAAEIRRRQVARQQNSQGGRGGQSGNQDLSALFDRELQRQQRTNYEQRARASQSSEARSEDESLRRLRDLAARQDELGRQQQELARRRAQLTTEEIKRRLERLTREQEELQREANELARRLQQESGGQSRSDQQQAANEQSQDSEQGESSGQSARQSPGERGGGQRQSASGESQDSRRLREAAREMAGAAGDLQRESPESAAQRSGRALERLRSAEQALSGGTPDERRRRAGDLQAQARQMAEAERRLASEASATSEAGAGEQGLRRLADEQARLAERAQALEEATRDLAGREPRGPRGETARRAAREVSAARLGQRLRASAEAAREAAEGGQDARRAARSLADEARAAAQPLERLADRLGEISGQDAESQRLSDGLAQTRALRERLRDAGGERERRAPAELDRERAAGERNGQPGLPRDAKDGTPGGSEGRSAGQDGGNRGGQGLSGGGGHGSGGTAAQQRERLLRELRDQGEQLDQLRRGDQAVARALAALEGWTPSLSAPGTEAWKQDFARWEQLARALDLALERQEATLASRLAERQARDRLDAGADDRPPDGWRREVADYYRAVAGKPRQ
jgi:hypothetical protein